MGPPTAEAIRSFQRRQGLPADRLPRRDRRSAHWASSSTARRPRHGPGLIMPGHGSPASPSGREPCLWERRRRRRAASTARGGTRRGTPLLRRGRAGTGGGRRRQRVRRPDVRLRPMILGDGIPWSSRRSPSRWPAAPAPPPGPRMVELRVVADPARRPGRVRQERRRRDELGGSTWRAPAPAGRASPGARRYHAARPWALLPGVPAHYRDELLEFAWNDLTNCGRASPRIRARSRW